MLKSNWRDRLTSPFGAGLLLILFYAFMLLTVSGKSLTFDEPGNAVAGYTYWKSNDYRIDPENGNLPQRWVALPLLLLDTRFPARDEAAWQNGDSWELSDLWFNRLHNSPAFMAACGRAMAAWWAVGTGLLVWLWSRLLFGPTGGMISLVAYVLTPAVLGNGPLMTSDFPATFFFLASLWCFRAMLERFSIERVLLSALVMGGLFVTKMSCLLIVPVVGAMAVIRIYSDQSLQIGGNYELSRRTERVLALGIGAIVHLVVVVGVIWMFYGFRFVAFASADAGAGRFEHPWQWVLDEPAPRSLLDQIGLTESQRIAAEGIFKSRDATDTEWTNKSLDALTTIESNIMTPSQREIFDRLDAPPASRFATRAVAFARVRQLLPEAYLYGFAFVLKRSALQAQFLNGEFSPTGWWTFFPYAFLVKTPLPVLGLLALAVSGTLLGWRIRASECGLVIWRPIQTSLFATFPLWFFAIIYFGVAILSRISIGHRHLLPVYPALFVLGGAAVFWVGDSSVTLGRLTRFPRAMVWLMVAWLAGETAGWAPNFLAYFNEIVPSQSTYQHLVDSSLDWGQDLPGVRKYLERQRPAGPVYFAYFGMASPASYGVHARLVFSFPGYDQAATPVMKMLRGASPRLDDPAVAEFIRQHADYDPTILAGTAAYDGSDQKGTLILLKAEAIRFSSGTYLVSASLLQPLFYPLARGEWNDAYERTYQHLLENLRPLLTNEVSARTQFLLARPIAESAKMVNNFDQLRFARLTAYLRKRKPDDNINHSILVYHLSSDDIARATESPAPE